MMNADRLPDTLPATGEDGVILKRWLEGLLAAAFLYLLIVIFFRDLVFGGEVFAASGDSIPASTFEGWGRELMERGIFPLWNPYIFSGMPSFGRPSIGRRKFSINPSRTPVAKLTILAESSLAEIPGFSQTSRRCF